MFDRFQIYSTLATLELGPAEDAVTVAGEGGYGGGHHHGRFFLFSTWSISGGSTRSIPGAGSITHSFPCPVAATSPPIRNRTGLGLDGGLLRERNSPGLGRHGEDAVTVMREGGGGHQTERYCPCPWWPAPLSGTGLVTSHSDTDTAGTLTVTAGGHRTGQLTLSLQSCNVVIVISGY